MGWGGGGRQGRESEGSTARTDPEDRGPSPEQWKLRLVLKQCLDLTIARQLVYYAADVSTAVLGQSHKDNVRCTAVE